MNANGVCASQVLSTNDLKMRSEQDLTEIVARFLTVGEGVIAHWVEYARGVLLFVMASGDERSGEFYVYDRKNRHHNVVRHARFGEFGDAGVAEIMEAEFGHACRFFQRSPRATPTLGRSGRIVSGPFGLDCFF